MSTSRGFPIVCGSSNAMRASIGISSSEKPSAAIVGIPTMAALGFSDDEIPMLARIAFEDPQTIGNPREVDIAGYEEIYRKAFGRRSEERRVGKECRSRWSP